MKTVMAILAVFALICGGCKRAPQPMDQKEMKTVNEQRTNEMRQAFMSGELDQRMKFYDDAATLLPDGFLIIVGKTNIRSFLAKGMAMAQFSSLTFNTNQVAGSRHYIRHFGIMNSEILVNDSLTFDNSSKFFFLWKLQDDGSYKIVTEMYNNKNEDND